jgi:hypothetical protein
LRTLLSAVAGLVLLAPPSLLGINPPSLLGLNEDPIPYEEFGKGFLKEHGNPKEASELPWEKLRTDWCVHARLGAFDVAYPIAFLNEKPRVDDLKALCTSLLELEAKWAEWLATEPAKAQPIRADVQTLQSWVKKWSPGPLAHQPPGDKKKDLFELLSANEAETKAAERLAESLCKPDLLGVAPKEGGPLRVLFSPNRRDYVELMGYVGLLDETKRAELWKKEAAEWTTFWVGWDLVVAMQYPPWSPDPGFRTGLEMDKFDKSGLEQHAVQQVANAWQWSCYGDDGVPFFHQAVAMNLAIAVCGELNALEGDGWGYGTTGATTMPYERFIPGGNPSGGVLPAIPAIGQDSLKKGHWREGFGKDHFAAPLRKGQKNGLKALPRNNPLHLEKAVLDDKDAHFLLISEDESVKHVVSAPFFGPEGQKKIYPPTPVIVDYREFFRAYKSAFFHWLQTSVDPKDPAACAAKYRELLRKAAERDPSEPFETLIQSVYGVPFSGKDGKSDSLEWRFLAWLGAGK